MQPMARRTLSLASTTCALSISSASYGFVQLAPLGPFYVPSVNAKASAWGSYKVQKNSDHSNCSSDGLQVCIWIESIFEKNPRSRSRTLCFEDMERRFHMDGLEMGSHRLLAAIVDPAYLRSHGKQAAVTPFVVQNFDVLLQESNEFIPSYEWQEILEGQSVPQGLEVRLPLDGYGRRTARIPPLWQLQLWVELGERQGGGGFFLRHDVRADSTVEEIRREIARHPKLDAPLACVELFLDAEKLRDDQTVSSLQLFQRQKDLVPVADVKSPECT